MGATFGQLLDQWLEECERLDLSPTTLRNYESSVRTSIRPRPGQVPLSTLSAKHLDTLDGAMPGGLSCIQSAIPTEIPTTNNRRVALGL